MKLWRNCLLSNHDSQTFEKRCDFKSSLNSKYTENETEEMHSGNTYIDISSGTIARHDTSIICNTCVLYLNKYDKYDNNILYGLLLGEANTYVSNFVYLYTTTHLGDLKWTEYIFSVSGIKKMKCVKYSLKKNKNKNKKLGSARLSYFVQFSHILLL